VIRAAVFVDYEDCVLRAREAFRLNAASEFDPLRLTSSVIDTPDASRAVSEVRVYRAVPDPRNDLSGYAESVGQIQRWSSRGMKVIRRSAQPGDASCGRKGLAVTLATDLLVMAMRDRYDVGIVCSADQDLEPGLAAVLDQTWKTVEIAEWRVEVVPSPLLRVAGEQVRCHWLDRSAFEEIRIG
jgi:NYN domain